MLSISSPISNGTDREQLSADNNNWDHKNYVEIFTVVLPFLFKSCGDEEALYCELDYTTTTTGVIVNLC